MNWTIYRRLRPIYLPPWTSNNNNSLCTIISNNTNILKKPTKFIPIKLTRIKRDQRTWKRIRQNFWSIKNNINKKLKIMVRKQIIKRMKMLALKGTFGNLCSEMLKKCTILGPRWEFKIQRDSNRNFWGISKRNRLKYLQLKMLNKWKCVNKIKVKSLFRKIKSMRTRKVQKDKSLNLNSNLIPTS